MSLNSELKNLKFLLNSGISVFMQNNPNPIYQTKKEDNATKNSSKINNISDIQTLVELEQFIRNSNACALKNNAIQAVISDGNPSSKIMLIGEAPGADEDKYGKPFVGRAGQLLNKMLESIGLNRNKIYTKNSIKQIYTKNKNTNQEQ